MQNTLSDLNNHLFAQLERLGDEDLKGEKLEEELKRADSITKVSQQIVANGTLALKAEELKQEYALKNSELPVFLENKSHA